MFVSFRLNYEIPHAGDSRDPDVTIGFVGTIIHTATLFIAQSSRKLWTLTHNVASSERLNMQNRIDMVGSSENSESEFLKINRKEQLIVRGSTGYHADSPEKKSKSFIERLYAALISPLSDTEPHPIKVRLINGWHDFTSEKINIVVCNFLYDKTSRSHKMWKELETITGFRREHLFYALCAIFCYLLIQGNSLPVVYSLVVLVFPAVCTLLALNDQQLEGAIFWLKYWVVYAMITTLGRVVKRCAAIKQMFQFNERPLSLEEQEYPLAYGIIVYMNAVQILFELAAFYHPQNEYCIAVSGSAEEYVQEFMLYMENCFPNIHVLTRPPINWGEFEIINTTFACLQQLQKSDKPWKYYQYLSGVDVPLRTNLEMVKIFKRLNDTASLTRELLDYLTPTFIADESFWGTMLGNPLEFNVSGSFNARQMIAFKELYQLEDPVGFEKYSTRKVAMNGYISRYQVWTTEQCKGKIVHFSCVYGVEDLPVIVKQHYLVAHKFYIDYQPAAYFCMLKRIRKRTHTPEPFDASIYAEIPLVEFSRGVAFSNLTHPEWLLNLHGVVVNN
ncbi:unnamed protein product [Nippostrongylus brasiliensis]|uniref:Glyco_trans_2-like domain-containing protein n=1 Tax=Nippostrongylus brasiliensis TaxID=27835 RepID=A0A0N4YRG7_NIPBR|nr:unnamed protein product [Nippostrongylus brasiliensis]